MLIMLVLNNREQVEVFMLKQKLRDMNRKADNEKEKRESLEDSETLYKFLNGL